MVYFLQSFSFSRCLLMAILIASLNIGVYGKAQVPCLFIFGDSLSDSGNNNNLFSTAKANFYPYGIDFPGKRATGRFCNGRTTFDLIGDYLGFKGYIPPYHQATGKDKLRGINYASGSAGIRPETGAIVGDRISMDRQLNRHQTMVSGVSNLLGSVNASRHLGQCIYSVWVASNDWMLNYFSGSTGTSSRYTPDKFADALIAQLAQQLTKLYRLGARKVVLTGVGPLGCLPSFRYCQPYVNNALQAYDNKLKTLAGRFNKRYKNVKFIYINTIGIVKKDLSGLGLKVLNIPCCGGDPSSLCTPFSYVCPNRDIYAYWDDAHTTEAANKVLARRAYKAKGRGDAYPMDISRLAKLKI